VIHEIQQGRLNLAQSLSSQDQIDDFSLDCIADLFARDAHNDFYLLKRVFDPQLAAIILDPPTVFIVLRKLISSRVHQSLIALFSSVDRGGWKIWRNLSLVSKRADCIREFGYMSVTYLYSIQAGSASQIPEDLNPNGLVLEDELLSEWIMLALKENYGLPKVVQAVFKTLSEHDEYQQFIDRGRIFHSLVQHQNISYTDIGDMELASADMWEGDPAGMEINTDQMVNAVQGYIQDQLQAKYLEKGKIDAGICQQYTKVLDIYFSDLLCDGYVDKLNSYVDIAQAGDLSNGEWLLHRGRLEYMIKLGKDWLRSRIEAEEILTQPRMML